MKVFTRHGKWSWIYSNIAFEHGRWYGSVGHSLRHWGLGVTIDRDELNIHVLPFHFYLLWWNPLFDLELFDNEESL